MNLRDIKKDIEYVIGAFVDDCALFLSVHPGISPKTSCISIPELAGTRAGTLSGPLSAFTLIAEKSMTWRSSN